MSSAHNRYMRSQVDSIKNSKGRGILSYLFGSISSISKNGKSANVKITNDSEMRDMRILSPYGIASSGFVGMNAQIIRNDGGNVVVGMYDMKRPDVKPGEVIIYTRDGTQIKLANDGKVSIVGDVIIDGNLSISGTVTSAQ